MPDSSRLSVSLQHRSRRPAGADDPAVVIIGNQAAAAFARHRRNPGIAKTPTEDRPLDPVRGFHGDRQRELMRGATEIVAAGRDVDRAGETAAMVEQRRHGATEDTPLLAEMFIAVHQDRPLLGKRGAEPIGSLERFSEIRARIDAPLQEHPVIGAAGKAADQHGRVGIGQVDAISGVSQHTREILHFRYRDPD